MSKLSYQTFQEEMAANQNPPPYSEKEPYIGVDFAGPAPPEATTPMPPQHQPHLGLPGSFQAPTLQLPQAIILTPIQTARVPDYLAYSIFTMLCCCLPLGIAALVFSIQTREANYSGNTQAAQHNSKMARTIAHVALSVGIVLLIVYIVLVCTL